MLRNLEKKYDLLEQIIILNESIELTIFANEYEKINPKYSEHKGNNPMTFFNEFIKQLGSENKDILNLFTGKNNIRFHGMDDMDYEEEFIFFMISLDKNFSNIDKYICREKCMEDDNNIKITEKITLKPEIFIINLEVEDIEYDFEEIIYIDNIKYELRAINEYNDFHSTV